MFVRAADGITLKDFRIFNCWGNQVYQSNRTDEGWDGTYPDGWTGLYHNTLWNSGRGSNAMAEVYVYYVRALCRNGAEVMKKCSVTVVR